MATFTVTNTADSGAGSLRQAMEDARSTPGGDVIVFDAALNGQTITLADDLPRIIDDLVIDGGTTGVTVSGNDLYRVFWASSGAITIQNLTIAHGLAKGGAGGRGAADGAVFSGSGGGGAGLGGGLFIDENANVTLRGVTFADNAAQGGDGGSPRSANGNTGGGGGMDSDGESSTSGVGGVGGGPNGGAGGDNGSGAVGGVFSGGGGGDFGASGGGDGGDGGFGGGGGGGGGSSAFGRSGAGGDGGFGGGGGSRGGGGYSPQPDPGAGGYGGGNGGDSLDGGGGAGLGGAVFVRDGGSLTLENVAFGAGNIAAGGAGPGAAGDGSGEGAGLFLMGGGTVGYSVGSGRTVTVGAEIDTDAATMSLNKTGDGTLVLDAATDFTTLTVSGGTLRSEVANLSRVAIVSVGNGNTLEIAQPTDASWGPTSGGGGALLKTGSGALTLNGTNGLSITVAAGTLRVMGAITSAPVVVQNGGTLQGTGLLYGADVRSGGVLAPGVTTGTMDASTLTMTVGAVFAAELGGIGAGQYDKVKAGTVVLGGATLTPSFVGAFSPTSSATFTLIENRGSQAVSGTFAGYAQGAKVQVGDYQYSVDYLGGDGNDVVLTVSYAPPPPPLPPPPPSAGTDGADLAILSAGDNAYAAGGGDDMAWGEAGNDTLHGNAGNDTLYGGSGDDWVRGGQGHDVVYGGEGDDLLFGDKGDDLVHGGGGHDACEGGEGQDTLHGGQGDDLLVGGAGDDWLSGDRGDDTLTGGAGADIFYGFSGMGRDAVTDFDAAQGDRIVLAPGTAYTLSQSGADVVVQLAGDGGAFLLQNVSLASLGQGWIVA